MRTKTLRGLAAGAGAAAVLVAGASAATAIPGQPTAAFWESYFAEQGYEDVVCLVSVVPGVEGQDDIVDVAITDEWADELEDGNEWIGVVLKVANEYDVHAWEGYGSYHYGLELPGESPGNITHAIVCQAPAEDDEAEQTETPGDDDEQTETPGETEEPSGPPVETDGPASPEGMNLGMVGGAALVLAGAGAAGWAMRRRPGQH